MPKILCTLPNASSLINGIRFERADHGMQSVEDLPDEVAAGLASIPGYQIVGVEAPREEKPDVPANAPADQPKKRGRPAKNGIATPEMQAASDPEPEAPEASAASEPDPAAPEAKQES
jgi:hypothetical protein